MSKPLLFSLGQPVATPGAMQTITAAGMSADTFLARHQHGDWGDLSDDDKQANDRAIIDGGRIFSAYLLRDGTKVWVITEAAGDDGQRASTCILLPGDY